MNKVTNLEIDGYDFTGMLNNKPILGSFCVSFEKQYPSVHVSHITCDEHLTEADVDLRDLEEQIAVTDDGKWYDEYQDALLEKRRERSEDR